MFHLFWFLLGHVFCEPDIGLDNSRSWNYNNLHCRDNENSPVDWWILLKPPSGVLLWDKGLNFSYITSEQAGKWIPSDRFITGDSMLTHTLAPLYRPTYTDHLAFMTYGPQPSFDKRVGSEARGILLADELSGVWLSHTVRGLPDIAQDRLHFPEDELPKGHLIICLSATVYTLNELAKRIRDVQPHVTSVRMPEAIKKWLPEWQPISHPLPKPFNNKLISEPLEYETVDKTLRAQVMINRPGDKRCLYKVFAKTNKIVLDVYGHHKRKQTTCEKNYSVRKIDAISVNHPNHINENSNYFAQVVYVNNQTDRLEFAVSTAAHWQRSGGAKHPNYWACIGSCPVDDYPRNGGLILCIENYEVWRSFDILKVKEPHC